MSFCKKRKEKKKVSLFRRGRKGKVSKGWKDLFLHMVQELNVTCANEGRRASSCEPGGRCVQNMCGGWGALQSMAGALREIKFAGAGEAFLHSLAGLRVKVGPPRWEEVNKTSVDCTGMLSFLWVPGLCRACLRQPCDGNIIYGRRKIKKDLVRMLIQLGPFLKISPT